MTGGHHGRGDAASRRTDLDGVEVDVLVVGGGIAGVSTAAGVAEHASVLLVEAEDQLSRHSTGRSAAAYLPSYGAGAVRALTLASRAHYDAVSTEIGTDLLTRRPLLWLGYDAVGVAAIEAQRDTLPSLRTVGTEQVLALCPALRPEPIHAALLDSDGADIDVAGLHQAYVARLRSRGGRVATSAAVLSARRDGAGWRVRTAAGTVRAAVLVDAAGAWADEIAARCGVAELGLQPMRRTACISPVPAAWAPTGTWPLVCDASDQWYFRPEGPARLLVSLSEETPVPAGDARPDDADVALAIERVNAATHLGLRRVEHAWAGLRSFVADRMPVAGAWPEQPGFVFVAGQGGYGIQLAPALADVAAALVLGRPLPDGLAAAAAELGPGRLAPA